MLPIFRNGVAGLSGIDPAVIEAANAVGMTSRQRLFKIEVPQAAHTVMAGIRTAAVWTIGAATLSTAVGQTSLGNYIFSGLQTENWIFVLFGCVFAAALALITDQLLGLIEVGASRRDPTRIYLGLTAIASGTVVALIPLLANAPGTYLIGAKNFSEQFILAELISERLEAQGASTQHRDGLGSAIAFRALASGEIDVYVDYSGTLWTNVMERRDVPAREMMLSDLTRWMTDRYGVVVLGSLGFENAYALAMRARRRGLPSAPISNFQAGRNGSPSSKPTVSILLSSAHTIRRSCTGRSKMGAWTSSRHFPAMGGSPRTISWCWKTRSMPFHPTTP